MVFYRKYRPQTIEELDNKNAREALTSILSSTTNPHAFLFMGPKGLGKTSSARIVAKVLNCEKNKDKGQLKPCNKCAECKAITNGTSLDVIEIDGASNRGIDQIRDLKERIKLAPAKATFKVYIIDEVHMLTQEAFDALLKTLEEPPAHVVFVLCTTEPHKIPPTISSRCFEITFTKATPEELIRSLTRIAKGEKIKAEKEALFEIAEHADGSFRDAAKIFEEIAVYSKGKITKEEVGKRYQTKNVDKYANLLLKALKNKNAKEALDVVSKSASAGQNVKYFLERIIFLLHRLLLVNVGVEKKEDGDLDFDIEEIKEMMHYLTEAYGQLKYSPMQELPLEIAIVEIVGASRQSHVAHDARPTVSENQPEGRSLNESLSSSSRSKNIRPAFGSFASELPPSASKSSVTATPRLKVNVTRQTTMSSRNGDPNNFLEELIAEIKGSNHSLAGVLRSCAVEKFEPPNIQITAKYKFHKERLEEDSSLKILEKAASQIIGKKARVQIILKTK